MSATRAPLLTGFITSLTTSRRRSRCGRRSWRERRRQDTLSRAGVVGPAVDWGRRDVDHDDGAWVLECEDEARAGLATHLPELEERLSRHDAVPGRIALMAAFIKPKKRRSFMPFPQNGTSRRLLAEGHLTRRLFGTIVRRRAALSMQAGWQRVRCCQWTLSEVEVVSEKSGANAATIPSVKGPRRSQTGFRGSAWKASDGKSQGGCF